MSLEFLDKIERDAARVYHGAFSQSVEVRRGKKLRVTVPALYDSTFLLVDPDTGTGLLSQMGRVSFYGPDLPFGVQRNDVIVVAGKKYFAANIEKINGMNVINVGLAANDE